MSAQEYYAGQGGPPQGLPQNHGQPQGYGHSQGYGQPQGYLQPGHPQQAHSQQHGGGYQAQPSPALTSQPQSPIKGSKPSGGGTGCLGSCLAAMLCCLCCDEACECCMEMVDCC